MLPRILLEVRKKPAFGAFITRTSWRPTRFQVQACHTWRSVSVRTILAQQITQPSHVTISMQAKASTMNAKLYTVSRLAADAARSQIESCVPALEDLSFPYVYRPDGRRGVAQVSRRQPQA